MRINVKKNLAEMLKGGVIMDVVNAEQAKIAEEAGAVTTAQGRTNRCRKQKEKRNETNEERANSESSRR